MVTHDQVIQQIYKSMDHIGESILTFPWESPKHYGFWLAQTYHYVVHSTRFAAKASALAPVNEQHFHYEFMKGVAEEKGHDILAENDLKALGYTLSDFPELTETAVFYQSLTYLMDYESYFAMIGYAAPLEGLAAKQYLPIHERVEYAFGLRATSFLRIHCTVDQDHFREDLEFVHRIPKHHLPTLLKATVQAGVIYKSILEGVVRELESPRLRVSYPQPERKALFELEM